MHFLSFRPRIPLISERSAENELIQFGSVSVRFRCICETALMLFKPTDKSLYWKTSFRISQPITHDGCLN